MLSSPTRSTGGEHASARRSAIWRSVAVLVMLTPTLLAASTFRSSWPEDITRYWIGPEFWSNTVADWRISNGPLECLPNGAPLRTVHLLTRALGANPGNLIMSVHLGLMPGDSRPDKGAFAGFLVGAGPANMDYRGRCMVFGSSGTNGGLVIAINGDGALAVYDNGDNLKPLPIGREGPGLPARSPDEDLELHSSSNSWAKATESEFPPWIPGMARRCRRPWSTTCPLRSWLAIWR